MKKLAVFALLAVGACSANAYVLFDFEEFAATSGLGGSFGALNSLTSTHGGLTMQLSRTSQTNFDIFDNDQVSFFPLTWDHRSLDPFVSPTTNDYFVANFSTALRGVELEMTDFGGDDDTIVLQCYSGLNGTGTLVGQATNHWGTNSAPNFGGVSFQTSTGSFQSILFRGESTDFPNSMYVDNIAAVPVPEPASMAVLGLGAIALLRRRARMRS